VDVCDIECKFSRTIVQVILLHGMINRYFNVLNFTYICTLKTIEYSAWIECS